MTPIEFLRARPPFDRLTVEGLRDLEAGLEIAFEPKDARILERGGPPSRVLHVIRKGTVDSRIRYIGLLWPNNWASCWTRYPGLICAVWTTSFPAISASDHLSDEYARGLGRPA